MNIVDCFRIDPRKRLVQQDVLWFGCDGPRDIQNVILYLRNRSIGILVTDHNVRETLGVTDRAYIMADGRIFRSGVPRELTEDAEVRRLYLGEKFRM